MPYDRRYIIAPINFADIANVLQFLVRLLVVDISVCADDDVVDGDGGGRGGDVGDDNVVDSEHFLLFFF